jgi:hypothetical protein
LITSCNEDDKYVKSVSACEIYISCNYQNEILRRRLKSDSAT